MRWYLCVLLCVALLSPAAYVASAADEGTTGAAQAKAPERRYSFDLRDTPLADALDSLFRDTPWSYAFDEPGLDDLTLTLSMEDVSFSQALKAILEMNDLTYCEEGGVYHISRLPGIPSTRLVSRTEVKGEEEPRVNVDFSDTPLPKALDALLEGTPYSYQLENPDLKDLTVTLYLAGGSLDMALRAITLMHDLVYKKEGNVYHISRRPQAEIKAEEEAARKAYEEEEREWETKHQMLYWTDYGGQAQLRLQAFPYPGNERVLWRSPGNVGTVDCCIPSPSYQWIALEWGYKWFVVRVGDGNSRQVAREMEVHEALWRDDHRLALIAAEGDDKAAEWEYDTDTEKLTKMKSYSDDTWKVGEALLESAYAKEISLLRKVIKGPEKDYGLHEPIPISDYEVPGSILRAVGYRFYGYSDIPLPRPKAAFSPDGEYLAVTTGADAVFILLIQDWPRSGGAATEYDTSVSAVIPVTKLVAYEGVSVQDLRWSPDSKHVTFTEEHYHPARFYATDVGPRPDPLDSTSLVRMFSFDDRDTKTVVVGENAFLLPKSAHLPLKGPWR